MKILIILIILSNCCVSCRAQNLSKSLKNDITEFYKDNNEIQEKDKQKILNNFEGLVSIVDLKNPNIRFSNNMGIYKVSLNITHTTSSILICHSKCKFYPVKDNYIDLLFSIILFIKQNKTINKTESMKYIESFIKMIKENKEIRNIDVLEFKEN